MASPIPAIQELPPATQSQLRSTQILTSLSQVVSELVQNSLDANATHIEVGINCEEWECWVRDNGIGIAKDAMLALGNNHVQRRYNTSKAYNLTSLDDIMTFGFRGEALASAADISCIEISSRTSKARESWSIIIKGNDTLYSGPSLRWRRESQGTVVCIHDAFFNLPIRRLSHLSAQRTLELIRRDIEAFALVFPNVSFTLENTKISQNTHPDKARILAIPKTTSTLAAFRHIHGRALAEHVEEIHESQGEIKIAGFISLEGGTSKAHQFLFLNRHLLSTCELHKVIDQKFNSSLFSKRALDEYGDRHPATSVRHSPRKTEKKPIYVLNITVPLNQVDNSLEPAKSAVYLRSGQPIMDFLCFVVQTFLVKHGFAASPTRTKRTKAPDSSTPRKKRKTANAVLARSASESQNMIVPEGPLIMPQDVGDTNEEDKLIWTDPRTGIKFVVDQRTGNSHPYSQPSTGHDTQEGVIAQPSRIRRTLHQVDHTSDTPEWIRKALTANQAYALIEPKIPSLSIPPSYADGTQASCRHACDAFFTPSSQAVGGSQSTRFDKADLHNARVLGQVDKKFIACVVDPRDSNDDDVSDKANPSLLLVDQHAADERVRVERFLGDLCSGFLQKDGGRVEQRKLDPPAVVLLTTREMEQLTASPEIRDVMSRWGFTFSELGRERVPPAETNTVLDHPSGYAQVMVDGVPELLASKLLAGDELHDVMKGFLLHTDSQDGGDLTMVPPSQASTSDESSWHWQIAMRWCPKELLELVNSKACRGAIMFNDSLNAEQCERLIRRLSECAMPFQCAHGRPSLVPLTSLTGSSGIHRSEHSRDVRWEQFDNDTVAYRSEA